MSVEFTREGDVILALVDRVTVPLSMPEAFLLLCALDNERPYEVKLRGRTYEAGMFVCTEARVSAMRVEKGPGSSPMTTAILVPLNPEDRDRLEGLLE